MQSTFTVDDIRSWDGQPLIRASRRASGYRGIWFTLGFQFECGDKYSGGLGTYTANHQPVAVYDSHANRTFFTYGGTLEDGRRELAVMVSCFDHGTGTFARPVILYLDPAVDDPHDNASVQLDRDGYLWVFKSGRGALRPGIVFRATKPHSLDAFECVSVQEFTYPQVWYDADRGFLLLFSKYTFFNKAGPQRALYWKTSPDGRTWSEDRQIAAFDGHYQTSAQHGGKIATYFNWHPGSDNDRRTNVYYAQTTDWGRTWTTAEGTPLSLPLTAPDNGALIADLHAEGRLAYTCDLNFDAGGNPILLYVVSRAGEPGPKGGPREWTVLHWKNGGWRRHVVTTSGHNYDMGSLYADRDQWTVIGPTGEKPQAHGTGGEIELWRSRDEGATWTKDRQVTRRSTFNHSYARRPLGATDPFFAFWADGNPDAPSASRLYFTNSEGSEVWVLPERIPEISAQPASVS